MQHLNFSGTKVYNSPEISRDRRYHGKPAAVWSLGILLYVMVCGNVPFDTDEQIKKAELDFENCRYKVSYGKLNDIYH